MNYLQWKQLKMDKAQEIIILLDLFEGKVTLNELLHTDISLLVQLRDAKLEVRRQQELMAAKAKASNGASQNAVQIDNSSIVGK